MKIYRIENADGDGPYNAAYKPGGLLYQMHTEDDDGPITAHETHPSPWADIASFASRHEGKYRFGFKSMEQLTQWFGPRARKLLESYSFELVEYEVPDKFILPGYRQVAYHPLHAEQVKRTPIGEIK